MSETNKKIIFSVLIVVLIAISLFIFLGHDKAEVDRVMTLEEYKIYVVSELVREVYSGTLAGYDANTLIGVFSGLTNDDFDGLNTGKGVYEVIDGGLVFRPADGVYGEEKLYLSNESIIALLNSVSNRIGQNISTREGFEEFIMKIK